MVLKYKNTTYSPTFEKTNSNEGLKEDNFWINIKLILKNEDIDFDGEMTGMSFHEIMTWNEMNKRFLDGNMRNNESIKFIKRMGELLYYPKEDKVEKRLYLFPDVNKYYSIYFTREELFNIYNHNKEFIDSILNNNIYD